MELYKASYLYNQPNNAVPDAFEAPAEQLYSVSELMEDLVRAYDGLAVEAEKSYTGYEYILENCATAKNGTRERDVAYADQLLKGTRLSRSILARGHEGDLTNGVYGSIRRRLNLVPRKNVLYYGKKHGVSENVYFVTAFNYCIHLFSDEDDVFCSSIHSGRTDSRWSRLAGFIFRWRFIPGSTTSRQES